MKFKLKRVLIDNSVYVIGNFYIRKEKIINLTSLNIDEMLLLYCHIPIEAHMKFSRLTNVSGQSIREIENFPIINTRLSKVYITKVCL